MKRLKVSIPWNEGLHLRPAAKLAELARSFQSSISLKFNDRVADAKSVLAVLLLCATFGSVMDIETSGVDEDQALAAIISVFESDQPAVLENPADREDDNIK